MDAEMRSRIRLPRIIVVIGSVAASVLAVLAASSAAGQAGLTPAQRAARAALRARVLASDRRSTYRAPRIVLDHFAVFSSDALNNRTSAVTVSRPRLASLPFGIIVLSRARSRRRPDIHHIRQIRLADGLTLWVVPEASGLCLYTQSVPHDGESFGTCTAKLSQAISSGNSINLRTRNGKRVVAGVVPDTNQTIRVRTATGKLKSIPVTNGVYTVPAGLRHIYIKSVFANS